MTDKYGMQMGVQMILDRTKVRETFFKGHVL